MYQSFDKLIKGYKKFRSKYTESHEFIMRYLYQNGQSPKSMIIGCCDSRVDPAIILQCNPGDLFIVRNIANIVPPYQKDGSYHGTSSALEYGIRYLNIEHLILLGHSECGGIHALLNRADLKDDFITSWVSIVKDTHNNCLDSNEYSKLALKKSFDNAMSFPWIKEKVKGGRLMVHLWYFDIKLGALFSYDHTTKNFKEI